MSDYIEAARAGRRATLDPGAFVKRGRDADGDYERLDLWQERALLAAVAALTPTHPAPTSTTQDAARVAPDAAAGEGEGRG